MDIYYTNSSQEVVGPVTAGQLQSFSEAGLLPEDSQACFKGSNWKPYREFLNDIAQAEVKPTPSLIIPKATVPKAAAPTGAKPEKPALKTSRAVPLLLVFIVALMAADLCFRIEERRQRQEEKRQRQDDLQMRNELISRVHNSSLLIDLERKSVFSDYRRNLNSYETQSVYHQIYHANNAQLMLLNLSAQEQQLMIELLAGKK